MFSAYFALFGAQFQVPFLDLAASTPLDFLETTITSDTIVDENGDFDRLITDLSIYIGSDAPAGLGGFTYEGTVQLSGTGASDPLDFIWPIDDGSVSESTTGASLSFESQGHVQLSGTRSIDPLDLIWDVDDASVHETSASTETAHSSFHGHVTETAVTGDFERTWEILRDYDATMASGDSTTSLHAEFSTTGDIQITGTGDNVMVEGEAHLQNLQDAFLNHVRKSKLAFDAVFAFNGDTVDISLSRSDGTSTSLVPTATTEITLAIDVTGNDAGTGDSMLFWDPGTPTTSNVGVELLHSGLLSPQSIAETDFLSALFDSFEAMAADTGGGDALSVLFAQVYAQIPDQNADDFSFLA